jgi:hypothetical protein
MTNTRKQRKKKWTIGAIVFLLMAGLLPAQASSPSLPLVHDSVPNSPACSQVKDETIDGGGAKGTCDAGGTNCCSGYPETTCTGTTGGFYSV